MKLAVTEGDPAGIGPEIIVKALREFPELPVEVISTGPPCPGSPSKETGRAALEAINQAVDMALAGEVQGMVNAPVSKEHVIASGTPFTGHTEYLALRSGVKRSTMLHVSPKLRIAIVTTHVSIRDLPDALTHDRILLTIRRARESMIRDFGIPHPRIAVTGLNPHAGEGGNLGREEIEIITPAIEEARAEGADVTGPVGGDSIHYRAVQGEFDLVVAMFHDQALAPLKTIAFDAVNCTLGLPFVRTSVDHGTGFDIAGQGTADHRPFLQALRVATRMVQTRFSENG